MCLYKYIYIYIYMCVCVCMYLHARVFHRAQPAVGYVGIGVVPKGGGPVERPGGDEDVCAF